MHDTWNPTTSNFDGDIAYLRLAQPITYSDYIRPICLPKSDVLSIGNGDVVGWGVVDDNGMIADFPREVNLPIINEIECLRKDRGLIDVIWPDSFCAGKQYAGVCKGDSGSGFYVQINNKFYLRGIVSSSTKKKCSQTDLAIYTDVYKYLGFINKVRNDKQKCESSSMISDIQFYLWNRSLAVMEKFKQIRVE